jgi:endonuclease/exonuclease/phosphatase family metal-dependent hydrolase
VQTKNIKAFLDSCSGEKILCGDFNLKPSTKSLAILEKGMRNLIKDYRIDSTRTLIYDKPERFADYVLVSPGIKVKSFDVLDDTVSDHSPLVLDFS